jgi:hypothetical protein
LQPAERSQYDKHHLNLVVRQGASNDSEVKKDEFQSIRQERGEGAAQLKFKTMDESSSPAYGSKMERELPQTNNAIILGP